MDDNRADRQGPTLNYRTLLERDAIKPADDMRQGDQTDLGLGGIPRERYFDPAWHRREVDRLWSRTWQFACREEQIPEPGDMLPYDIVDRSAIVVRSQDGEIRAFVNSCTHRGTRLCSSFTSLSEIRCPYHAFTWNLEGTLTDLPAAWDFPHVQDGSHNLDPVRVARWGGFVFVNFDPDAPPLEDYLGDLPAHMAASEFDRQYIAGHYVRIVPCNWKSAMEAFVEAYHVPETHTQASLVTDEWVTQYDCLPGQPHWNRFLQPMVIKPRQYPDMTEQDVLQEIFSVTGAGTAPTLPEGQSARAFAAAGRRAELAAQTGRDFSALSDAEMVDSLQYMVFPNTVIFRGYGVPAIYRFRPNRNDPDSCIFDLYAMRPAPAEGPLPPTPDPVSIGDGNFADSPEVPTWLGHLFDQDVENLSLQQLGMKASMRDRITLSRYQEVRIRHFHQILGSYLAD